MFSTPATFYTNTGLTNDTTYYYVVSAVNASGESADSAEASATPSEPPVSLSGSVPENGQFDLQFAGTDGQSYTVEISTNLMDWTPIYTNMQSGGLFSFTDTNAADATRFYRVRQ